MLQLLQLQLQRLGGSSVYQGWRGSTVTLMVHDLHLPMSNAGVAAAMEAATAAARAPPVHAASPQTEPSRILASATAAHRGAAAAEEAGVAGVARAGEGAPPPAHCHEQLRQLAEKGSVTDRGARMHVDRLWLLATHTQAAAGSSAPVLPPRLQRHFCALHVPPLGQQELTAIFVPLFCHVLGETLERLGSSLVSLTLQAYAFLQAKTRQRPHCPLQLLHPRDVLRVALGMRMALVKESANMDVMCRLWVHELERSLLGRLGSSPADM